MSNIITFYSYKGGVGRSMALANIAYLLAKSGSNILMVDWDLEAPGLERYFSNFEMNTSGYGLLPLLMKANNGENPKYQEYTWEIKIDEFTSLSLLQSGRSERNPTYSSQLESFNWDNFFNKGVGGAFLESLREAWLKDFDFVLIDSRTGLSDASGICTILLPDTVIALFTANHQSLYGVRDIMRLAQLARQKLNTDRMALTILPIPARFGARAEFKESQEWIDRFSDVLKEFYSDWLPRWINPKDVLERIKVPQIDYFSFGEKLAVVEQGINDPESMGYIYDKIASLLSSNFSDLEALLGKEYLLKRDEFIRQQNEFKKRGNKREKYYSNDLFISYTHDNLITPWLTETLVPLLKKYLTEYLGYEARIYIDYREVSTVEPFAELIKSTLEQSKLLLSFITPTYFNSPYNLYEWNYFSSKEEEYNGERSLIFPIQLKKLDIYNISALSGRNIIDYTDFFGQENTDRNLKRLKVLFDLEIDELASVLASSIKSMDPSSEEHSSALTNENQTILSKAYTIKVFVSFDYNEDITYKHLLRAWDTEFDLEFSNDSFISTKNNHLIDDKVLQTRLQQSKCFLALIGKNTHTNERIKYEIDVAKKLRLPIVIVKIRHDYIVPNNLIGTNAIYVGSFIKDEILNAIKEAQSIEDELSSINDYSGANQVIKAHCKAEWPDDFFMQKSCIDQQQKAVYDLKKGKPTDISESDFLIIRRKAALDWPNDFFMRANQEQQQYEALRSLKD